MKAGWEETRRGVQLEAGFEAWPRDEQSGRRPPWNDQELRPPGDAPGSRGLDPVSEGPRSKTDARSRDILVHQRRCLRFPARVRAPWGRGGRRWRGAGRVWGALTWRHTNASRGAAEGLMVHKLLFPVVFI